MMERLIERPMRAWPVACLAAALLVGVAACAGRSAGTAGEEEREHAGTVVTLWTDAVELFFEAPALVAGQPGESWAIHLTDLRDFRPIVEGALTLRFTRPAGEDYVVTQDAPSRPGVFGPAPSLPAAGMWDLTMELVGSQLSTVIPVGSIQVYATLDEVPHADDEEGAGIGFLKEQQWPIPFATATAARRAIRGSIAASGTVAPAADGLALVSAPVDGLILAEANRMAPAPGQRVRAGQTLAVLAPVGDENAYASQVATEQRLARELARAERLHAVGAISDKRLEEARHAHDVARATRAAMGAPADGAYELALTAPIGGVVDERHLAAGQRVAAGDLLFSIVDPRRVWLRFNVRARDAVAVGGATGAAFTVEGSDQVYRAGRVVSVGNVIDPERRTLPVIVEVDNADLSLKHGMLADGLLFVGDTVRGVAIPRAAVQDEDGTPVAYVQVGGETFERRVLRLGWSDGEWTIVESGVALGERVVTVGAYQVKLASLNTSDLADQGHVH